MVGFFFCSLNIVEVDLFGKKRQRNREHDTTDARLVS